MNTNDIAQLIFYFVTLIVFAIPIGIYIGKFLMGEKTMFDPVFKPIEKFIYVLSGIDSEKTMDSKKYLFSVLIFNLGGLILLFGILMLQGILPLNPQKFPPLKWDLALNTAMSFVTNTNWQSYSGEAALSYFSQMVGLTVQNFLSAAVAIAVFSALVRALISKGLDNVGNFWVDMTRTVVYLLLPLSIIFACVLVGQGVVQNFSAYVHATGGSDIPGGPAASQIAIKQLGTNGGGFFGVNSAHPFENPTPFSNFLEMLAILLIPAAFPFAFGKMIGRKKDGIYMFIAMMFLLIVSMGIMIYAEYSSHPVTQTLNMEGKETRFGIINSVIWSSATTAASNGSVNSMHDSFMPLSGMAMLFNMMTGEVILGGVGCGLYGMLLYVILTVFIAGLMVGRTPEYLGKKIEKREILWVLFGIVVPSFFILIFTNISVINAGALASRNNPGAHGFSEILYVFTSTIGNNGSAFAGINTNTVYYNLMGTITLFAGRFAPLLAVMLLAQGLSVKKIMATSSGTFRTDTPVFTVLLISMILIMGALTFFPALTLGPILEHMLMR